MNVAELIAELQKQPQHYPVMVVASASQESRIIECCIDGQIWLDVHGVEVATNMGDIGPIVRIFAEEE